MKECLCLPQAAALSIFYNHHNVQQRYRTIHPFIKYLIVDEAKHRQWHWFSTACIILSGTLCMDSCNMEVMV